MADVKKIVTIAQNGTVSVVKDLEDGTNYFSVRDSFQVKPANRKTIFAQKNRRYAGQYAAAELHDNAAVEWKVLVSGSSADNVNANVESMLSILERATLDTYLQWKPDGATNSSYFEIRGPATWSTDYKWVQYVGTKTMVVTVQIPVAPLVRGDVVTQTFASTTLPSTVSLSTTVGGNAPALCDVSLRYSSASGAAPIWALIGWGRRPNASLSGTSPAFGFIDAENFTSVSGWSAIGTDTSYRNDNGLRVTTSGAGSASANYAIDPATMHSDEFTTGTVDIEIWARFEIANTVVSPKVIASLEPALGSSYGQSRYTAEWGSSGKVLTVPTAKAFRFTRLGTITLPVEVATSTPRYHIKIAANWAAGSSGTFGFDYLCMVPARQRAVSKSGVANDSAYPDYIISTSDTTKTIRSDLSGLVRQGATGFDAADSGLGGTPIEIPPGDVDFVFKLSSLVADDPTSDATTEQKEFTGVTGTFTITPRYWALR